MQRGREKGFVKPPNTVYVGRPTEWGNPYVVGKHAFNNHEAVKMYTEYFMKNTFLQNRAKRVLAGKNLMCWCKLDEPCHADFLLGFVNV